jgi:dihydroorotase (multifunctional complex type)
MFFTSRTGFQPGLLEVFRLVFGQRAGKHLRPVGITVSMNGLLSANVNGTCTMSERLLLCNGNIVTGEGVTRGDMLIEGEQIVAVAPGLAGDAPGVRQIDLAGLAVLPGLIDVHVHLREPGGEHKEDLTTGTCAALAGGVTTVFAMPNTNPPITSAAAFYDIMARAAAKAVCDYGFYVGATPDNAAEAARLADQAVGLKMYIGSSTGTLLVDQLPAQIAHFEAYPADRIIAVHAEDEAAVQHYAARGQRRPPICAALATAHAIALAEQIGRRLHICHVSTGYEMTLIRDAKARGLDITCEVAPHHLFMTLDDEERIGSLGRVNPPLRSGDDVDALWAQRDVIDMIATDHAPHTLAEKAGDLPPSGMPGLETMLPLLLTAYHEGRLSLPDVVRWIAARPAEVFGLEHKGRIRPGCDADLTIVDLDAAWTVGRQELFTRCGWTPFEGRRVRGRVRQVYLRGQLAFSDGRILAKPGSGRPAAH